MTLPAAVVVLLFTLAFAPVAVAADKQGIQVEAKSYITVLVDLSETWLNDKSRTANTRVLKTIADAVSYMAPSLKPPVKVLYLRISDGSMSRPPLCEARFKPNIFPSMARQDEFATIDGLAQFLGEDCAKLILMQSPAAFTDITGALNTVSRLAKYQHADFKGFIVLSDFHEERRPEQLGTIGSLAGLRGVLVYRVLETDRYNPELLTRRISTWETAIRGAGAKVKSVDDISLEPALIGRLLTQ